MASIKIRAKTAGQVSRFMTEAVDMFEEHGFVNLSCSDIRSLPANAAIRLCYKQIQQHSDDTTAVDIERFCKWNYGVPILRRDCEIQEHVFGNLEKKYGYERMIKIMDMFSVTSSMSTKQSNEMIKQMMIDHPYIIIDDKDDK